MIFPGLKEEAKHALYLRKIVQNSLQAFTEAKALLFNSNVKPRSSEV